MVIERIPITADIMRVDTRTQVIDMQQIDNRRFLYNPKTGALVLGRQYAATSHVVASHAVELADAGISEGFDDFVRGWVGTGRDYPNGVIHFAPNVDERCPELFNRAFDTLEMFAKNGAMVETVIRGFGGHWEQPLFSILSPQQQAKHKPPVQEQQNNMPGKKTGNRLKSKHYER